MAHKKSHSAAARSAVPSSPVPAQMDLWSRIAWACLHALVIIVPIAMSNLGPLNIGGVPLTYDQFDIIKVVLQRGLLIVALASWAIGLLVRGGTVRFTRGEWVLLAFLGWIVLTTALSISPATAVFGKYRRYEGMLSFFTYGAAFFLALQLADRPERVRLLARSLAIGGFAVAAYGAVQVVGMVSMGVARVLLPLTGAVAIFVPIALAYLALTRYRGDAHTRMACWTGAVIALWGAGMLALGLAQNIDLAATAGLTSVSIDPVRWGSLPFEQHRAFSMFGNPDLLGGYLIFPWAITLGLALSEEHRLWRGLYWAASILTVFVGITSYVRGAWIGATVALIALVIAYWRARSGTKMRLTRADRTFIGGAAITALGVTIGSSLRADAVRNVLMRILSIFEFDQGSALTRSQIWQAAAAAVAESPVFGWGADTFRLLFPMFKPAAYVAAAGYLSVADNVHNYPLQLASGIGIPGAVLFYGIIGVSLAVALRTAFSTGTGSSNLLLAGFWAAVIGYVVHLMFGLSVTGSTIMMWLSMGVLLGPSATARELRAPALRPVAIAVVGALAIAALALNARYFAADTHYLKGRVLTSGAERVSEIERAIELNPYNEMYRLELGSAWRDLFLAAAGQYAQTKTGGTPDEQLLQLALEYHGKAESAYEEMIAYVPQEYDTYVFLANLHNEAATYVDASFAARAADVAARGIAVEEYGPAVRVQFAMAKLLQGELGEAEASLEYAVKLDPNYKQAFIMLAEVYRQQGRTGEARAILEMILASQPSDTDALTALQALEGSSTTTAPVQ